MAEFIRVDEFFYDPAAEVPERLFHGTTLDHSKSILTRGPRLDYSRDQLDFGPGFYTTRDFRQGFDWAVRKGGACLAFSVDAEIWSQLSRVSADENWHSLVDECLRNLPWADTGYDVIEGQICKNPEQVRAGARPEGLGTQTVLKSRPALKCLILDPDETWHPSSHGLNL